MAGGTKTTYSSILPEEAENIKRLKRCKYWQ